MATTKLSPDEKFENVDFDLFKAIDAIDRKDYGWWDTLTEEQTKKFSAYMLLHWISSVKASGAMGAYYIMSTDLNANKHMFNERIQQHPHLQWLMLCSASPGMGKQYHQWIPHLNSKLAELKTKASFKEVRDYFEKVYPSVSKEDVKEIAQHWTSEQNHQHRLAELFPDMKIDDIKALSKVVTAEDLDKYEAESGN
jgi:hypothetical protein